MQIKPEHRLPTGNDVVSIPSLMAGTAEAADINVLSMRYRGLVEFKGAEKAGFLKPCVSVGGKALDFGKLKGLKAGRLEHWVPEFAVSDKGFDLALRVLAPLQQRGFIYDYEVKNKTNRPLKVFLGAQGCWQGMRVCNNDRYALRFWREASQFGGLASRHLVLMAGGEGPEFAVAIGASDGELDVHEFAKGKAPKAAGKWKGAKLELEWDDPKGLYWVAGKNLVVAPGVTLRFGVLFGLGLEAVSAGAASVEMKRQGLARMADQTLRFLARRKKFTGDAHLDGILNLNLWFNYFYAMGCTLDTEDFVCLTSRSPHYYVNGAYWDRDSMLWSFPAVLMADAPRARKMLEYAFGIQGRNIGVHSRFLTGAVLEPGFELDELCAPFIALASYVRQTGDAGFLKEPDIRRALRQLDRTLQSKRHPSVALYETTSGPDDDFEPQPYLTIDNALVWRLQNDLAELKAKMGRDQDVEGHRRLAADVKSAVWKHLAMEGPKGRMFAWSSDLRGGHRFYTSPPGCLQLLVHYGFCEATEQTWKNTAAWLHGKEFQYSFAGTPFEEIGCAHAPQPWTLGLCNRLLSGQKDRARPVLDKLEFDGGVACEAFDAKTGKPYSGLAFATCAGFLAYSMFKAFGRNEAPAEQKTLPKTKGK